eukprot:PITA_00199
MLNASSSNGNNSNNDSHANNEIDGDHSNCEQRIAQREVVEIVGGTGRRNGRSREEGASSGAPCGACKFLRRKCISGCIFAPYFGSDQGAARFAAVHKVFGASNVSKLLLHIPQNRRHEAVVTICYEAQARLSDPVYGCVSTIFALQQQVDALRTELSIVQAQLMNSRLAAASAMQQQQQQQAGMLQQVGVSVFTNNPSGTMSVSLPSSSLSIGPYGNSGMKDETQSDPCAFHGMHYEVELPPTIHDMSTTRTYDQNLQMMTPSSHEDQSDDPVGIQGFPHTFLQRK